MGLSTSTLCGYYCGMTAGVGAYFFLVLGIMEMTGNASIKYIWNYKHEENDASSGETPHYESPDWSGKAHDKAIAFFVLAGIEAVFLVGCCICANVSRANDAKAEEDELRKAKERDYQMVSQNEGMDQIVS